MCVHLHVYVCVFVCVCVYVCVCVCVCGIPWSQYPAHAVLNSVKPVHICVWEDVVVYPIKLRDNMYNL